MRLATAAMIVAAVVSSSVSAQSIVVPNALAGVESSYGNRYPFNSVDHRYQQVYAASQFAGVSGSAQLTQIAFRRNAGAVGFSITVPDVTISLSTTGYSPQVGPNLLTNRFADNPGPDSTTVHTGPLTLTSSATGPTGGPNPFDIVINLSTPFTFNPAQGNLLMDVRIAGGSDNVMFFDATLGDGNVNRVWTNSLTALTGSVDQVGLVTRFTFVPEPGMLLGAFVVGAIVVRRPERHKA
jgi:hypothetical protein